MKQRKIHLQRAVWPIVLLTTSVHAVTFNFTPSEAEISRGDQFSVNLNASGLASGAALGGYDLDILFQPENISLTVGDISLGNQLQLNGVQSVSDTNVEAGRINLTEVSLNSPDVLVAEQADSFTLATLTFTGQNPGQSELSVASNALSDQAGGVLDVTGTTAAAVSVQPTAAATPVEPDPEAPDPEPTPDPDVAVDPNADSNNTDDASGETDSGDTGTDTTRETSGEIRLPVAGFTQQQLESASALSSTCQSLQTQVGASPDQQDLAQQSCAIVTQIAGNPEDNETIQSTLNNIAAEETLAPATMSVKTSTGHFNKLQTQLAVRRRGMGGFDYQNLSFIQDGQVLSLAALGLQGARGGSAGDDNTGVSERWSGFLNGTVNFGDTDTTRREDGFDFEKQEVVTGVDYRLTDQWVAGLAAGYTYYKAGYHKSSTVSGGDTRSHAFTSSLYSTYYFGNFYLDGIFSYTRSRYDISRAIRIPDLNIDRLAEADPESDQYAVNLGLGYEWHQGSFSYGPYAQLSYLDLGIDGYQETGAGGLNLKVGRQQVDSLETVLGMQFAYAISHPWGVMTPQIRAEWHHEFRENTRTINTQFVNDPSAGRHTMRVLSNSPDRDFAHVSASVSGVFQYGLQGFLSYETILFQSNIESHAFTAGLRIAF